MIILYTLFSIGIYNIIDRILNYLCLNKKDKIFSLIHALVVICTFNYSDNYLLPVTVLSGGYYIYDMYLVLTEESKIKKYLYLFHHAIALATIYVYNFVNDNELQYMIYFKYADMGACVYYVMCIVMEHLPTKIKWPLLFIENIIYMYYRVVLLSIGTYEVFLHENKSVYFMMVSYLSAPIMMMTYLFAFFILKSFVKYTIKIKLLFYLKQMITMK